MDLLLGTLVTEMLIQLLSVCCRLDAGYSYQAREILSSARGQSREGRLTVCVPSSRLINSLEKVNPGIKPLFFNQNIAAKLPEKNMPSTHANATSRTRKGYRVNDLKHQATLTSSSVMYFIAQSAFFLITGTGMSSITVLRSTYSFPCL